jgi:aminoglycoside phosphotransferase (APT) family kinase protein
MVHGDIDDHHVLLDRRTAKLGIIDFGDAALGDPAADFAFLFSLPPWAAEHALARYAFLAGDPGLPERAMSHSVRFAIGRLWNCLQHVGYPRVFADATAALETQLGLLAV